MSQLFRISKRAIRIFAVFIYWGSYLLRPCFFCAGRAFAQRLGYRCIGSKQMIGCWNRLMTLFRCHLDGIGIDASDTVLLQISRSVICRQWFESRQSWLNQGIYKSFCDSSVWNQLNFIIVSLEMSPVAKPVTVLSSR
jgi:hypothetical protein